MKCIFFISLLVFLFFCYKVNEGFSNETNVNDFVYKICPNKYNNIANDYKINYNPIKKEPIGFYSSILEAGGIRDKKRYLSPPICVEKHDFVTDYWINNKLVDCPALPHGNCDTINSNGSKDLYKDYKEPLFDPFYPHSDVGKNYSIIYPEQEREKFIELHIKNEMDTEKIYNEMKRIKNLHDNDS